MPRAPSGLRDNPIALAFAVLGLVGFIFGLGFLTFRIGSSWAHVYAHRQSQPDP